LDEFREVYYKRTKEAFVAAFWLQKATLGEPKVAYFI